jgi:hypothetical protein
MRVTLFAMLVLVALTSCTTNQPIHGRSGEEAVGSGTVIWDELDNKVWLIIWFDIATRDSDLALWASNSKLDATTGRVEWERGQTAMDGRKFGVRVKTDSHGESGEVEINGRRFQVEDGRVFLVSTRGDKPDTIQLRMDLSKLEPTRANLLRMTEDQPQIKAYVDKLKLAAE